MKCSCSHTKEPGEFRCMVCGLDSTLIDPTMQTKPQLSAEKRWIKKIQQQRFDNIKSFLLESSATEKEEFINELADMMVMEIDIALEEQRMKIEVETGLKNFQVTMEEIAKARKDERATIIAEVEALLVDEYMPYSRATPEDIEWQNEAISRNDLRAELRAKLEEMKGNNGTR